MSYFTKKLFNFFSSFKILKIITIFTLFININCGKGMIHLFDDINDRNHSTSVVESIDIIPADASIRDIDTLQYIALGN